MPGYAFTPNSEKMRATFLDQLLARHLPEACIGSITEVFDAEAIIHPARLYRSGMERSGDPSYLGEKKKAEAPSFQCVTLQEKPS